MHPILRKVIEKGYANTVDGRPIKVHSTISCEEGNLLQDLIIEIKPTTTLEIGLAYGVSSLFICEALKKTNKPNLKHIVIDPNQFGESYGDGWEGVGLNNLRKAGYDDLVKFYNSPSYQVLPKLEAEGCKIDFAFIDGWHTFDYVLVDFFYIDKMLKVGGIVVFDDAGLPSIRKACRYIATNYSYSVYKCVRRKISFKRHCFNVALQLLKILLVILPQQILSPEVIKTDIELNLHSDCIAFKKESEDKRKWDIHIPF